MKQYYTRLIGRIFKMLGKYEEDIEDFKKYTTDLAFELSGNKELAEICQIRFKLYALLGDDVNHYWVRKTVFECIDLVDRILSNWSEGD